MKRSLLDAGICERHWKVTKTNNYPGHVPSTIPSICEDEFASSGRNEVGLREPENNAHKTHSSLQASIARSTLPLSAPTGGCGVEQSQSTFSQPQQPCEQLVPRNTVKGIPYPTALEQAPFRQVTEVGEGMYDRVGMTSTSIFDALSNEDVLDSSRAMCEAVGQAETDDDEVCFGMIERSSIPQLRYPPLTESRLHKFTLQLRANGTLFIPRTQSTAFEIGTLDDPLLEALTKLCQYKGIALELRCIFKRAATWANQTDSDRNQISFNLYCNIYGPKRLFEKVGDLMEMNDICLQDPQGCDRNVRYRNPHRLRGMDDDAPMTADRLVDKGDVLAQNWHGSPNFLDDLEKIDHNSLSLANPPAALTTNLFDHQLRALSFMQARERGWNLESDQPDIWKKELHFNHSMYLNTISDDLQLECPPVFRGGVLADSMGLGKTLEILSLIAADLDQTSENDWSAAGVPQITSHQVRCTLVVVPPTLLTTWEQQLTQHCDPTRVKWFRHHGRNKIHDVGDLGGYHVLLTTYDTVIQEWKKRDTKPSVLYATYWHRIILDEAHLIRTQGTKREAAIFDLEAHRRWAVTGTPIQNSIYDFASLLQFLRVHPYDQPKRFEQDIINVWKDDPAAGPARTQRLISYISIRRTLQTVDLPPRVDEIHQLPFTEAERDRYESVAGAIQRCSSTGNEQTPGTGRHILQALYNLRAICNFGALACIKPISNNASYEEAWGPGEAQTMFDGLVVAGLGCCVRCKREVATVDELEQELPPTLLQPEETDALISQCGKVCCYSCVSKQYRKHGHSTGFCSHSSPCASLPVSKNATNNGPTVALTKENTPTKIKHLVQNICTYPASKSVVFSVWRETLNLAAAALTTANIRFHRYDGQMSSRERELALVEFRNDPSSKVILFTLQCGAVGLDLTVADRVYLMEPHWNPTVEEQALARVHRIGQKRPVTTVRMIIEETYEDEIVAIQKHKKRFVDLMLSPRTSTTLRQPETGAFARWRRLLT